MFHLGIAYCWFYMTLVLFMQQRFEHQNVTALTTIAMLGDYVGELISPTIVTYLKDEYGWRGSLIIISGIYANSIPFGLMLTKPKKEQLSMPQDADKGKSYMMDPRFICIALAYAAVRYNLRTFIFHQPSKLTLIGFEPTDTAVIMNIYGVSCVLTGSAIVLISQVWKINTSVLFILGLAIGGSCTYLTTIHTFIGQTIVAICYGMLNGKLFFRITKHYTYIIS